MPGVRDDHHLGRQAQVAQAGGEALRALDASSCRRRGPTGGGRPLPGCPSRRPRSGSARRTCGRGRPCRPALLLQVGDAERQGAASVPPGGGLDRGRGQGVRAGGEGGDGLAPGPGRAWRSAGRSGRRGRSRRRAPGARGRRRSRRGTASSRPASWGCSPSSSPRELGRVAPLPVGDGGRDHRPALGPGDGQQRGRPCRDRCRPSRAARAGSPGQGGAPTRLRRACRRCRPGGPASSGRRSPRGGLTVRA